jgi:hypothetical protein
MFFYMHSSVLSQIIPVPVGSGKNYRYLLLVKDILIYIGTVPVLLSFYSLNIPYGIMVMLINSIKIKSVGKR